MVWRTPAAVKETLLPETVMPVACSEQVSAPVSSFAGSGSSETRGSSTLST